MTTAQQLLHCLKLLDEKGPKEPCVGICANVRHIAKEHYGEDFRYCEAKDIMESIWVCWEKYSGDMEYPISHHRYEPKQAFGVVPNLWCEQYGIDRRELLRYLIKTLEYDINEPSVITNLIDL